MLTGVAKPFILKASKGESEVSSIVCTWVPGTTDTIRLMTRQKTLKIKLRQVVSLLGPQAVNDLYLRGRFSKTVTPEELEQLLKA
ncbi:hypothetical protein [Deinococcus rubellus]|uniref:Uncharacterized protein n=1 Tax=Deinococcus rubellus TaxID=1889240 RepID=A0ABY5YFA6_9DEIO|nr:hypothetical protein [Deinococcus rubellus]UWX63626.1 hypothetical protein N0D28_12945 [Deinococcus rubellus]